MILLWHHRGDHNHWVVLERASQPVRLEPLLQTESKAMQAFSMPVSAHIARTGLPWGTRATNTQALQGAAALQETRGYTKPTSCSFFCCCCFSGSEIATLYGTVVPLGRLGVFTCVGHRMPEWQTRAVTAFHSLYDSAQNFRALLKSP